VTRLKSSPKDQVIFRHPVLENKGLISDQTIEFTGAQISKNALFGYAVLVAKM
jgi:hypothetical protein